MTSTRFPLQTEFSFHPIAFAMMTATVAAKPPTTTVCHELRKGLAVVNSIVVCNLETIGERLKMMDCGW
jgi:hypothetical protein